MRSFDEIDRRKAKESIAVDKALAKMTPAEKLLVAEVAPKLRDRIKKQMDQESFLHREYEKIRDEVTPMVDEWFKFFAERLPREQEVEVDEDSLSRQGAFNRHSVMKPRNLLFGTVKNPRIINPSIKPRFIASILLDVSGSMGGVKLAMARKMLVFYCELFSKISREYGYIRFSIHTFSDYITQIKSFDQDYDSVNRYNFGDGSSSTVKVRLMRNVGVSGGTNMLTALQQVGKGMDEEIDEYPDYLSALYFMGDGDDTCGNTDRIRRFLASNKEECAFGKHMKAAIMLGNENQRRILANIFGDENTSVAGDFETLVEKSMMRFDEDVESYLDSLEVE